jgi:hypothetical protein
LPRYALYAVALVAIVHSLAGIASPRSPAAPLGRPAGTDVGAAAYAVSFARAYLTYDSSDPAAREAALGRFLGRGAIDQDAGFTVPASGSSQVSLAQLVADHPVPGGGHVYTVEADTSRLGTLYLAVTVARVAGGLELVGEPALVGPPASAPAVADSSQANEQIADTGLIQVATRAITNYLRGDSTDLQSDLATGAAVSVPQLALQDIQVSRVAWQEPNTIVGVDVQATDRAGGTYSLHYELAVAKSDRSYVTAIEPTT